VTARHFLDLPGADTVEPDALTARTVRDVARHRMLGVVHSPAGLGKPVRGTAKISWKGAVAGCEALRGQPSFDPWARRSPKPPRMSVM